MEWKVGKRYRNKGMIDIDIVVKKVLSSKDDETTMLIAYWHRFYNYFVAEPEEVTITKDRYYQWKEI